MKVKYIYNKNSSKDDFFKKFKADNNSSLILNKEYVVYAMTVNDGYVWYFICDENFTSYPNWHPCPLFEVIDGKISRYWFFSYNIFEDYQIRPLWAFPEWTNDPDYYDNLVDGKEKEKMIFEIYKTSMYLEFPDSRIKETAKIGDEKWLICPFCIDAWESSQNIDAMLICPNCNKIMNNPRYLKKI